MKRKTFVVIGALLMLLAITTAAWASGKAEYVYLDKILDNDYKVIVTRANGEQYLIEHGIGVLSIWKYEGKNIIIYSPGMFGGVGSKLILPDDDQEARIWSADLIDDTPVIPTPKPKPLPKITPPAKQTHKIIIAVDSAPVKFLPYNEAETLGELPYGVELVNMSNVPGWIVGKWDDATLGFISNIFTVKYKILKPKQINIRVEKGYLFNSPNPKSKVRVSAVKGTSLNVLGESGNFYYVSLFDYNFNYWTAFVSKTVAW